jgi:hypothetical protein
MPRSSETRSDARERGQSCQARPACVGLPRRNPLSCRQVISGDRGRSHKPVAARKEKRRLGGPGSGGHRRRKRGMRSIGCGMLPAARWSGRDTTLRTFSAYVRRPTRPDRSFGSRGPGVTHANSAWRPLHVQSQEALHPRVHGPAPPDSPRGRSQKRHRPAHSPALHIPATTPDTRQSRHRDPHSRGPRQPSSRPGHFALAQPGVSRESIVPPFR